MCPAPASGRFHRTPARDPLARAPRPGPPAPRSTRRGCRHLRANSIQAGPQEARDADAVTAAPTPCHVQASPSRGMAGVPSFRTPAAPHTSARAVLPRRPRRQPRWHPCGRSRWRSNSNVPFQGRRMSRSSPPASNTTDQSRDVSAAALVPTLPPRAGPRRRRPKSPPFHDVPRPRLGALSNESLAP